MDNTKQISDLKEFSYYNAHYTGNSYVKALFDETKLMSSTAIDALVYVKAIKDGFENEVCGVNSKWEFPPKCEDTDFNNMLSQMNVDYLNERLKANGVVNCSTKNCYSITINKDYSVVVKVYAYINISRGSIGWMDEEQLKLIIARKISFLKKP